MKNNSSNQTPSTHSNAPKFFVDHKKGEVAELMNLLKNPNLDRDINKKKDIIKRVIAYMTLGVDVSKLFHEMVKASFTDDIVLKKMVFLYIVNYAMESESAILAINTFLTDLKNNNPKIRGLALRSLCSLKFKGAYEYFSNCLYDSLKDTHPYVRKTAVMGLLKVYHLNPKLISERDIDTLYEMIKDKDNLVVMNTLFVLNEILKKEGGVAISGKMIVHLLNILNDFNEWGQNIVLELVSKYTPKDEEQLYQILNILEDKLKHSSSAIVLACTKVFINFTKDNEFLYAQVLKRLRDPLITLMTSGEISGNHELSYTILSHIYIIILKGGRPLFSEIYKKFFVKFEEPLYVKNLKIEIMVQIANETNYQDILNEMEEYVNDVSANFAKKTIRKIGSLGLRVESSIYHIVSLLKTLINRNIDYIVSETVCVVQTLLRKYPAIVEEFIRFLEPSIMVLNNDQRGLNAILWIIGEFGDRLEAAPYIIENLLDHFSNYVQTTEIIYSLLAASTKLFFKTPGEMQGILGKVYEMILKNYHDVDLRDRTYFYYNLLQKDIEMAKYIICGEDNVVDNFYTDMDDEYIDQVYSQFNTLSIIYQKPEEKFIKQEVDESEGFYVKKKEEYDDIYDENEQLQIKQGGNDLIGISIPVDNKNISQNVTFYKTSFIQSPFIEDDSYQTIWRDTNNSITKSIKISVLEIDSPEFVKYLESENIFVKAFGEPNNTLKMYLFSQDNISENFYLCELLLEFGKQTATYTIKSDNIQFLPKYEEYFLKVIDPII